MSVFKSLKGTFQNVQQDIFDGLRALTSLDSTPRHERYKQLKAEGISLDAGADLLYKYQKDWADIQSFTTESAKRAEEIDKVVGGLFARTEKQWTVASQLEEEAATLPKILTTLNDIRQLIGSLQEDFRLVEEELDLLENVCEEQALEREKASHMEQLAQYRKLKETEAHAVKGKLWKMLKDSARQVEAKKAYSLMERQEAFQDAFSSDMDYYRTHGHTDRLPSGTEFPKVSSLSEITIEEDRKALDEFLSSGEGDHAEEEGAFIEDDYTTDYRERQGEDFQDLVAEVKPDEDLDTNLHNTYTADGENTNLQADSANDSSASNTDSKQNEARSDTDQLSAPSESATESSSGKDGENAVENNSSAVDENTEPVKDEEKKEGEAT